MNQLPIIGSYGHYSSSSYDIRSALRVQLSTITLYYSYVTVVAYSDDQDGLVVCQNHKDWGGTTTGKHLNWIDGGDKKGRKPRAEFESMLRSAMERHVK